MGRVITAHAAVMSENILLKLKQELIISVGQQTIAEIFLLMEMGS